MKETVNTKAQPPFLLPSVIQRLRSPRSFSSCTLYQVAMHGNTVAYPMFIKTNSCSFCEQKSYIFFFYINIYQLETME